MISDGRSAVHNHTSMYRTPEFGNEGTGVQTPFSDEREHVEIEFKPSRYHICTCMYVCLHARRLGFLRHLKLRPKKEGLCVKMMGDDDYVCLPNLSPMIIAVRRIIYTRHLIEYLLSHKYAGTPKDQKDYFYTLKKGALIGIRQWRELRSLLLISHPYQNVKSNRITGTSRKKVLNSQKEYGFRS